MNITPQQSHTILTAMAEAIDSNDELNDGDIEKISHFAVAFILAEVESLAPSQAQPTERQWISVEERLPENNGEVIILYWPYDNKENERVVGQAHFLGGEFFECETGNNHHWPSHWMPLPKTSPIGE